MTLKLLLLYSIHAKQKNTNEINAEESKQNIYVRVILLKTLGAIFRQNRPQQELPQVVPPQSLGVVRQERGSHLLRPRARNGDSHEVDYGQRFRTVCQGGAEKGSKWWQN